MSDPGKKTFSRTLANGQEDEIYVCCHKCVVEKNMTVPGFRDLLITASFMILCPECGNKRCSKASDHELPCTGSNDSGQPGSVYGVP